MRTSRTLRQPARRSGVDRNPPAQLTLCRAPLSQNSPAAVQLSAVANRARDLEEKAAGLYQRRSVPRKNCCRRPLPVQGHPGSTAWHRLLLPVRRLYSDRSHDPERWQSGRMRIIANDVSLSTGSAGSNPALSAFFHGVLPPPLSARHGSHGATRTRSEQPGTASGHPRGERESTRGHHRSGHHRSTAFSRGVFQPGGSLYLPGRAGSTVWPGEPGRGV